MRRRSFISYSEVSLFLLYRVKLLLLMEANQHARVCVYSSELQTALKALFFYICRVRWLKQMSQEINENAKIAEQCPPPA